MPSSRFTFIVSMVAIIFLYCLYMLIRSCLVTPLTKTEYGYATWIYLHGIVESLPDAASDQQLADVRSHLMYTFEHYPCIECRMHILDYISASPVPTISKGTLRDYMFTFHNEVNRNLHKAAFTREGYARLWSNINSQLGTFKCHSCGHQ